MTIKAIVQVLHVLIFFCLVIKKKKRKIKRNKEEKEKKDTRYYLDYKYMESPLFFLLPIGGFKFPPKNVSPEIQITLYNLQLLSSLDVLYFFSTI